MTLLPEYPLMLLRCPRCAHMSAHREGQRFCTGCGHAIARPCPGCGREAIDGDRHCGFCGVALPGVLPAGAVGEPRPAASAGLVLPGDELAALVLAARERARQTEAAPPPPTKAHLDQADVDSLFA